MKYFINYVLIFLSLVASIWAIPKIAKEYKKPENYGLAIVFILIGIGGFVNLRYLYKEDKIGMNAKN